ncbi:Hypothetical predicted protein [Olea europaea subsp. europaea]|uniref:Uncharacterized protein n=1 Tax=Olea europaea subsp. europaea TaxID=158383 RepID=A0A8S0Q6Y9_OLEEU|nr:Hypothetical predicted protein [Olea europaea subsp. europaea]
MAAIGTPPVATTSVVTIARSDPGPMSYAQAIQKQKSFTSFNLPLRFPTEIGGEKGFVFSEHEMLKVAEDFRCKMKRILSIVGREKEELWQTALSAYSGGPKNLTSRRSPRLHRNGSLDGH